MPRLLIHILLLVTALGAVAETPRAEVSLLTCMPGSDIYELEGHTALRLRFDDGTDVTVNWGVFDFDSPGFVYRFVKGETDYMAAAGPTPLFVGSYARDGRAVREQRLDLTPAETERLVELISDNLRPENRVYRYNYVLDNCATRPLAMVEKAIGDTLRLPAARVGEMEGPTFRETMRRFHAHYPWYQFGIDLALGTGIDRPITLREGSFAPVLLADKLADATRPDGRPIVISDRYIVGSATTPTVVEDPTPFVASPMCCALLVLLVSLVVSLRQLRGHLLAARVFDTLWFGLCFLAGCVVTFLVFVSVHEATSPNWVILWLNPLCLVGVIAPWLKSARRLEFWYQSVNFALLILLGVVGLCGLQSLNPAFWPLMAASALRALTWIKLK